MKPLRKYILPTMAAALTFAACLAAMLWFNTATPLLGPDAMVPADIAQRSYALYGTEPDENGAYEITLVAGAEEPDLMLVLSAMRPFTLSGGGRLLYSYGENDEYRRVHYIPLGSVDADGTHFTLQTLAGQRWLKAVLTTGEAAGRHAAASRLVNLISIGMHIMMMLNCLTLFLQKRSERYLLGQLAVTLVSLVSALLTSDALPIPFNDAVYVQIQYIVNGISSPLWVLLCLLMAGKRWERIRGRRAFFICAGTFLLSITLNILRVYLPLEILMFLLFLLGAAVLVQARADRLPYSWVLLVCYMARFALRYYNQASNLGFIPNTPLLVYLYTPQIGNLVLLLAFLLAINHRFSSKFNESEQLVQELATMNATLDAKVAQRTQQLHEQQRQKRQMLLNTYHDLRSPLFTAQGYADMLQVEGAENKERLATLREKLGFLSGLTEDLFLIAKLEDGKITFAQSEIPLAELCRAIQEDAALRAGAAGIQFRYEETARPLVTGDGFRLKQALQNLVDNAFKYTPPGGSITLRVFVENGQACIAVRDTGSGIPPDELPHVFERYYHGRRSGKHASTGLGLSIAGEILRAHGGSIRVESTPGEGSTFTLMLPAVERLPDGL